MALICSESSDQASASAGERHKMLAIMNNSEPRAKIVPIHQFSFQGIHRQRSNVSVIAIALTASG